MINRMRYCDQRGKDRFAPAVEYVDEHKALRGGGLGVHFSEHAFEDGSCLLKQQDYSGCKMWVDAICLAFYIFDHGCDNVKEIRWICESRVGKLYKSKPFQFDVQQTIDGAKWRDSDFSRDLTAISTDLD